ncbi:hypothetical protein EJD97_020343 [Solanum chilense]|uniref:Uncharacterized protein n=1 Tax=Solanum chilense TaxID=4083 RepID=A0A6N2B5A8_SOLCI|nr:hypothetical protein EJD97_020343 [Solanum chilense]
MADISLIFLSRGFCHCGSIIPSVSSSLFPSSVNSIVKMAVSLSLVSSFKGLSLSSNSLLGVSLPIAPKFSVSFPLKSPLTIESAHKKGAGSTKNGRDSPGQRLGVKIYGDQVAKPGSIIVRQRGTKISVYPREVQPENPNSYRNRKRESFRLQRERRKARREGVIPEPQLIVASAAESSEDNPITTC